MKRTVPRSVAAFALLACLVLAQSVAALGHEAPAGASRKLLQGNSQGRGVGNGGAPPGLLSKLVGDLRGGRRGNVQSLLAQAAGGSSKDKDDAAIALLNSEPQNQGVGAAALGGLGRNAVSTLMSRISRLGASQGKTQKAADLQADGLVAAKKQGRGALNNYALGLADSLTQSGSAGRLVTGQAMASAIAGGPDTRQALAEATATVFCEGGGAASAWASALSIALSQDSRGCLVLNQARALAISTCGPTGARSFTDSAASSTNFGFCGLPKGLIPDFSFGDSRSGVDAAAPPGGSAGGNAGGVAGTPPRNQPGFNDFLNNIGLGSQAFGGFFNNNGK